MTKFEVPKEWQDELEALKAKVASQPEDPEDQWIRDGQAQFEAMTPEEQARVTRIGNELLERMQTSGNMAALDQVFRRPSQSTAPVTAGDT